MASALDGAERDRVDHKPRFYPRLDRKQPTDFTKHGHIPNR